MILSLPCTGCRHENAYDSEAAEAPPTACRLCGTAIAPFTYRRPAPGVFRVYRCEWCRKHCSATRAVARFCSRKCAAAARGDLLRGSQPGGK